MSALDLAPLAEMVTASSLPGATIEIPASVREAIRQELARFFWRQYIARRGEVLFKRKILFFSLTVTWRDVRPLFVSLFGEPPLELAASAK